MTDTVDRRKLRREYKESYRPMGVYQVRNKVNGKVMIASSPNLPAIFNRLRMELDSGSCLRHPELQKDWKELGAEAFELEVLEELEPPQAPGWDPSDDLQALLELMCEQRQPYGERGYNRKRA